MWDNLTEADWDNMTPSEQVDNMGGLAYFLGEPKVEYYAGEVDEHDIDFMIDCLGWDLSKDMCATAYDQLLFHKSVGCRSYMVFGFDVYTEEVLSYTVMPFSVFTALWSFTGNVFDVWNEVEMKGAG